jgi:hypothetical protein
MVFPGIPNNLKEAQACILYVKAPRRRCTVHLQEGHVQVSLDDLQQMVANGAHRRVVQPLAVLVQSQGVCRAVQHFERQLGRILLMDLVKRSAQHGPRLLEPAIVQHLLHISPSEATHRPSLEPSAVSSRSHS